MKKIKNKHNKLARRTMTPFWGRKTEICMLMCKCACRALERFTTKFKYFLVSTRQNVVKQIQHVSFNRVTFHNLIELRSCGAGKTVKSQGIGLAQARHEYYYGVQTTAA